MTTTEIRQKYLEFFQEKGHVIIPRAKLVPEGDPTTLFTGSGMQPLLPYLLGEAHPEGRRLVDSQPCFRAEDIDEVGDNRHTTFFEMLGNWSLGDYFKTEQLAYFWEFMTDGIKLEPQRLYVTVFAGHGEIAQDDEAAGIWQKLFAKAGIEAKVVKDADTKGMQGGRIFYYDAKKNWWSRAGVPENMPVGEPGGPDSEVFYEFTHIEHDPALGAHCHPNCDCGRFMEIGNSVFMQYVKQPDGSFKPLPAPNVDFGGGLERLAAASINSPDMFKIDSLWGTIDKLQELTGKKYEDHLEAKRIIADHLRSVVFMVTDGVEPSNNEQGYVLRRFFRRAIRRGLELGIKEGLAAALVPVVVSAYAEAYPEVKEANTRILETLEREEKLFRTTLERGVREFEKLVNKELTGEAVFKLFDTYGFPPELSLEEAKNLGINPVEDWQTEFDNLMAEQKQRSRTATAGVFKGGLADHSEQVVRYHTVTHLMYAGLKKVLGGHVVQRGSNITSERTRFDFSHPEKVTREQLDEVEKLVNEAIAADLPVSWQELPTEAAFKAGANGAFGEKYGDKVKVYTIGREGEEPVSREICGGPHVEHTGVIGKFKIKKEESSSAGVRRIKAVLQ